MIGDVGGPDDTPGLLDTLSFPVGAWSTIAYAVLMPLVTWWLARRRDVV